LHFHRPEQFVMLDTRATGAVGKFVKAFSGLTAPGIDSLYSIHAAKCELTKAEIKRALDLKLSNRELDQVLLAFSDKLRSDKS
jgi:hypothetical protein